MSEDFPDRPEIPDTFVIENHGMSIRCLHCGWTSYNKNDVAERYCGHCHTFHHDIWPPARKAWIRQTNP